MIHFLAHGIQPHGHNKDITRKSKIPMEMIDTKGIPGLTPGQRLETIPDAILKPGMHTNILHIMGLGIPVKSLGNYKPPPNLP